MKILALANEKGGVGKSALCVQLAHYFTRLGKRVLVVDLDHQGNTSKPLSSITGVTTLPMKSSELLVNKIQCEECGAFSLVASDRELVHMEKQADKHNVYANNLHAFLQSAEDKFDVCLIDTNPNPDIRMILALVVATHVVSPVQLNQEAIDGIGALLATLKRIAKINPNLALIGIIPNMVQHTPFQRENFAQIAKYFPQLLIKLDDVKGWAFVPNRSVIAEAQAAALPLWALKKTAARDAWREIEPAFKTIARHLGLD